MKKIVIVDDDRGMRELMVDILGSSYEVRSAEDGVAGLELIQREAPDLVVLDLHMPRMHGYEVCQRLRREERLKGIKILISSSRSYPKDIEVALGAGADSYIVKPFEVAAFLGRIEELLGQTRVPLAIRFWGTRGSIPAPGPQTQRYGGNTACTELRIGSQIVIVDAGTGIRELGNSLLQEFRDRPIEAHLFIGHTHWDHIQGFPFFTPFYLSKNRFKVYGVHGTTQGFGEVLGGLMQPSYFPVSMKEMGSPPQVVELAGEPLALDQATVATHYLNHPGVTVGFRFQTQGWTVSYISDHEPYSKLNAKGEFSAKEDEDVARFVSGSDLLICEAQYTDEEYQYKRSWGHSTFTDVLGLALKARVKRLALFHHDPTHTDQMMDRYVDQCREAVAKEGGPLVCFAAQEGMILSL